MIQKLRLYWFLLVNNLSLDPRHLLFLARHSLQLLLLNSDVKKMFFTTYGDFNWERDCRPYRLANPTSEGGAILGDVVLLAKTVDVADKKILLAGDRNETKEIWRPLFPQAAILTAGVHEMDYYWDYESPPPH